MGGDVQKTYGGGEARKQTQKVLRRSEAEKKAVSKKKVVVSK